MRLQITWNAVASATFLLLALLRWPHSIAPTPPPATTRPAVVGPRFPAGTDSVRSPPDDDPDGVLAPFRSLPTGAPLIGPGLRNDLDALVGSWDQLQSGMPRPDPWQARVTASLVANLLEDAAYQDALWLGRDPDPEQAREQITSYFSERRAATVPHVVPTDVPPNSRIPRPK